MFLNIFVNGKINMYRIECFIDEQWKPMSDNGLIVYYNNLVEAHNQADHLEWMCSENGMSKSFRVVNHTF